MRRRCSDAVIPPIVDMKSIRRVLIIKMSALGDIIHALPVCAALGETFPHLEIDWIVEEAFAPLVTGNPYLSGILTLPRLRGSKLRSVRGYGRYFDSLQQVRRRRYDLTLDLQGLTKSAVVALASGARLRLGYHWLREAAVLLERPIPHRPESVHIVQQYLDVAYFLGAEPGEARFPFHIPAQEEMSVVSMLCEAGLEARVPYAAINPSSAQALKKWGTEQYAALVDALQHRLGLPSVLVTTDLAAADRVQSAARTRFVNLAGRTNLKQLAAVLQRCAVHVCGDTGSGHLAAALGRPVVSLVGPTDPDRVCPYGQRANTISHRDACGERCDWHRCQYVRPHCLEAITVDEVVSRVAQAACFQTDSALQQRET
jgi:heptosyltransferase-1